METVKKPKVSKRNKLIEKIMTERYGDDDPKNDSRNQRFLESLSLDDLESLANGCDYH
jgi:hypothetical protein